MDSDTVLRKELLRSEKIRFATFSTWTSKTDPHLLAAAGFWHPQGTAEVICFSCETCVTGWDSEVSYPLYDHFLVSPECPFINGYDKSIPKDGNDVSPLTPEQQKRVNLNPIHQNVVKIMAGLLDRDVATLVITGNLITIIIPQPLRGGMVDTENFYGNMSKLENRINSFKRHHGQTFLDKSIRKYAFNGFFALSEACSLQCFSCRCIISSWKPGDDVLGKHQDISPTCPFLSELILGKPSHEMRESDCKICAGLNYVSVAAIPCGHCFCDSCFKRMEGKCGHCRARMCKKLKLFN
jgi:hypothetical protein